METKFQTSFIPKKPLVPESGQQISREPVNLFSIIGMLALILSLSAAGGVYGWIKYIEKQEVVLKANIAHNRQQFGNDIAFLQRFNAKINLSRDLLNHHMSVVNIFDIISRITTSNVRFTSFTLAMPATAKDRAVINLKGIGTSLSVLAFQSDVFGDSTFIKDPVISDFGVNEKGEVSFSFTAGIDPAELSFKKTLDGTLDLYATPSLTTPGSLATSTSATSGTSTQQ